MEKYPSGVEKALYWLSVPTGASEASAKAIELMKDQPPVKFTYTKVKHVPTNRRSDVAANELE